MTPPPNDSTFVERPPMDSGDGYAEARAREQELRKDHLDDIRRAAAITRVGAVGWAACVGFDYLQAYYLREGNFLALVTLRAVCEVALVLAAVRLAKSPPPSEAEFKRLATVVMFTFTATLAGMCVATTGFESIYTAGNLLVGAAVIFLAEPFWSSMRRLAVVALPHPIILFGSTLFVPELDAQLDDPRIMGVALQYLLVCLVVAPGIAACGAAYAQVRRELSESKDLGRYRLRRKLGAGGMSEVWAAYHVGLRREVALKILESRLHLDEGHRRRFEHEVEAMAGLTHPNTVRVFDFGTTDDGLLFYAMELLDGEDLGAFVRARGPLPVERAIHLIRQAAAALAEAHSMGIVHRDVKPENLFVTNAGGEPDFVRVLDFGIALFEHTSDEDGDEVAGSPATISPEVLRGDPVTAAADVYALGCVLYFALAGVHVFDGQLGVERLRAHLESRHRPVAWARGAELPEDLVAFVDRCLSKDPAERPADGRDFLRSLEPFAARHPWNPREDALTADVGVVERSGVRRSASTPEPELATVRVERA